eukprot:COSAG01_NODE_824_length_13299_cov_22.451364_9_plen_64_part_00
MCYGYAIMAFISNMYDDSILVGGGGVFWPPVLVGGSEEQRRSFPCNDNIRTPSKFYLYHFIPV